MIGLPARWPALLGYDHVTPRPEAEIVVAVGTDPLIACGTAGLERSAAFASDCGPHWCPSSFHAWDGYATMWQRLVGWVAGAT